MPLLAEYAITPDVLNVTSYSNANECEARLDYIKETILNAGLVRDLHDGLWSALFGPRRHQMHDHATAGTPAPASDAGARTWHRRGTELVRKLTRQNRLVRYRPVRPAPPTDDAEWCAEALATHAAQPFTGGVIVTEAVKERYATEQIVARIDRLSSADWWRRRQHCSARLDRTLADYETHLDPVLRCSNSLMFIDPHLDPTEPRYAGFARLLQRAGNRIPAPLVEIHRRVPPDRQKLDDLERCAGREGFRPGQRPERRPWAQDMKRRFRDALMAPVRSAGLHARVFMWETPTRFHDRYLISNLIGVSLPDGFDTGKGRTTWARLSRDDRDDIQREFDPTSRRHKLVTSFTLP